MERVIVTTSDKVALAGAYVRAAQAHAPAVVLLHMMPAIKESWTAYQKALSEAGFQSLAIDLRGHGESVIKDGHVLNYRHFTDAEHQDTIRDVEAAEDFFLSYGVPPSSIAFAGASIGANLALQHQAHHADRRASILFSPGLDYRGIQTEPLVLKLARTQSVFYAATEHDMSRSGLLCGAMAQTLFDASALNNKKIMIFDGKEHGTDMFAAHPELIDESIRWLSDIYL